MPAGRGLSAAVLARMRGSRIEAAVVWQHVCAGTGPATPPLSAAAWNTGQMPSLPGPRHRPRPPLVRATRPRRCPQPGPGGMRYRASAPDDPGVLAAVAPRHRQRMDCAVTDAARPALCSRTATPRRAGSTCGRPSAQGCVSAAGGGSARTARCSRPASPSPCLLCPPSGHFTSRPPAGTRTRAIPRRPGSAHWCRTPRSAGCHRTSGVQGGTMSRSEPEQLLLFAETRPNAASVMLTMYPAGKCRLVGTALPCSPYNTEWWVLSREPDVNGRAAYWLKGEGSHGSTRQVAGPSLTRASPGSPGRHAAQSGRRWRRADGDTACRREHTLPAGNPAQVPVLAGRAAEGLAPVRLCQEASSPRCRSGRLDR